MEMFFPRAAGKLLLHLKERVLTGAGIAPRMICFAAGCNFQRAAASGLLAWRRQAEVETHEHDVVIVGGGGAGLRAAIQLGEVYPKLRVAVVSKVYPMRSHTVAAEGGAAAVIKANDSLDQHAHDTVAGSDWMADQDVVEAFVKEAPDELIRMDHWGCPWSREPDGHVARRPFGGVFIE